MSRGCDLQVAKSTPSVIYEDEHDRNILQKGCNQDIFAEMASLFLKIL